MMFEQLRVRVVKRGLEVWGDTGRVALVPVNTATCKTTHTHTCPLQTHIYPGLLPGGLLLQDGTALLHLHHLVTTCGVLKGNTCLMQDGTTLLLMAAHNEQEEVVAQLLARGADANASNKVRPVCQLER
jgi:hypothetical protein